MRRVLALTCISAVLAGTGVIGQVGSASPAPSTEEALAKKADDFLARWDKPDMPGCGVGAIKDGRLVYKRGLGLANLDYDIPNTTDKTLFNLASASKPFTAMSIALLAQQGKLSLDDEIQKFLPEIPKYQHPITIRHLIHHTSGIREYQALMMFGGRGTDGAISDKTVLDMLARQKNVSFPTGTRHQYSNSNYHLLGIIVARVSGKSLRQFADENIFKPLGMKNTRFFDNRNDVIKHRAAGYMVGPGSRVRARASLFDLVGGGGVLTTVEDLALWDQNFVNPKVGTKEMMSMLTAPGTLSNGEKVNYAFGLFLNKYRGLPVVKHSGNMSGYRAQIGTFPEQNFTAIALCNNSAILPHLVLEKLADIYLEGQLKPVEPEQKAVAIADTMPVSAVTLSEKDILRYVGVYAHPESGRAFRMSIKDGKLVNSGIMKGEIPVIIVSENRLWVIDGPGRAELNAVFDGFGKVSEFRSLGKNGKPDVFVAAKPPADTPEKLAEYAGTYYGEEFDANHKISLEGGKMVLRIGDNFEDRLVPAYADHFTIGGGVINLSFDRDSNGKITGYVLNASADDRDIKGVAFRRIR